MHDGHFVVRSAEHYGFQTDIKSALNPSSLGVGPLAEVGNLRLGSLTSLRKKVMPPIPLIPFVLMNVCEWKQELCTINGNVQGGAGSVSDLCKKMNLYLLVFVHFPQKMHHDYFGGPLSVTMGTMLCGLRHPKSPGRIRQKSGRNPNSSLG